MMRIIYRRLVIRCGAAFGFYMKSMKASLMRCLCLSIIFAVSMVKLCRKCGLLKLHHKHAKSKDGLQYWCADCRKAWKHEERKEYHKKRYHNGRDKWLDSDLKRRFGIDLETYRKILDAQHGVCAICESECKSGRRLAVDHNHTTGKVRGLLCSNCNNMIGHAKDSTRLLQMGIAYLREAEEA